MSTEPPQTVTPGPRTKDVVLTAVVGAALTGAVISLQGRINGDLAAFGAGVIVSGWLSYVGTLVTAVLVLALTGQARSTTTLLRTRGAWWWYVAGLCGIPIVLGFAGGMPLVGVAVASVCAVAGQTVTGLLMDARGIGIPAPLPLSGRRLLAGAVAVAGLLIAVLGSPGTDVSGWVVAGVGALLFVAGAILCVQQAASGRMTGLTGNPLIPALTTVVGGTAAMTVILAVAWLVGGLDDVVLPGVDHWWLYLGGPLGMIINAVSAWAVRRLGVFALTLSLVGGQMLMALVLDAIGVIGISWPSVLAAVVVSAAVVLAMPRKPRLAASTNRTTRDA